MTDKKTYSVIVSDRAKRMLGTHVRFLAQVNRQAATAKKERAPLRNAFPFPDATSFSIFSRSIHPAE